MEINQKNDREKKEMENQKHSEKAEITENKNSAHEPKVIYTLVPEFTATNPTTIPERHEVPNFSNFSGNFNQIDGQFKNFIVNTPRTPGRPYQFPGNNLQPPPTRTKSFYNKKQPPLFKLNTPADIQKQIEYYFSYANLMKDRYLKSKMDKNGYIDVNVISGFPRMTNAKISNEQILKSGFDSEEVHVIGNFLRSTKSWWKFITNPFKTYPEKNESTTKPEALSSAEYEKIINSSEYALQNSTNYTPSQNPPSNSPPNSPSDSLSNNSQKPIKSNSSNFTQNYQNLTQKTQNFSNFSQNAQNSSNLSNYAQNAQNYQNLAQNYQNSAQNYQNSAQNYQNLAQYGQYGQYDSQYAQFYPINTAGFVDPYYYQNNSFQNIMAAQAFYQQQINSEKEQYVKFAENFHNEKNKIDDQYQQAFQQYQMQIPPYYVIPANTKLGLGAVPNKQIQINVDNFNKNNQNYQNFDKNFDKNNDKNFDKKGKNYQNNENSSREKASKRGRSARRGNRNSRQGKKQGQSDHSFSENSGKNGERKNIKNSKNYSKNGEKNNAKFNAKFGENNTKNGENNAKNCENNTKIDDINAKNIEKINEKNGKNGKNNAKINENDVKKAKNGENDQIGRSTLSEKGNDEALKASVTETVTHLAEQLEKTVITEVKGGSV